MDVWKSFDFTTELELPLAYQASLRMMAQQPVVLSLPLGAAWSSATLFISLWEHLLAAASPSTIPFIRVGRATQEPRFFAHMPTGNLVDENPSQLVDFASLFFLEKMLIDKGLEPNLLQQPSYDWTELGDILEQWLNMAARYIALAIASASAIIDF